MKSLLLIFALSIALTGLAQNDIDIGAPDCLSLNSAIEYLEGDWEPERRNYAREYISLREVHSSAEFIIQELIVQGRLSFNDSTSNYVNGIKHKLLAFNPGLDSQITVLVYHSKNVNAFMTTRGRLLITTNLLSRVESESELAFIIAHEIAHHVNNDIDDRISHANRKLRRLEVTNLDQLISELDAYSRKAESDADLYAIRLLIQSEYFSASDAINVLERMDSAYLPFSNIEFDYSWLLSGDSLFQVTGPFPNYDYYSVVQTEWDSTHPGIQERIQLIRAELETYNSSSTSANPFQPTVFRQVRKNTRLASIEAAINSHDYPRVIYECYTTSLVYPSLKQELELITGYALYALARLKAFDKYVDYIPPHRYRAGADHSLYFMLERLSSSQLAALALRYNYNLSTEVATSTFITLMLDGSWENFVTLTESRLEDFSYNIPEQATVESSNRVGVTLSRVQAQFQSASNQVGSNKWTQHLLKELVDIDSSFIAMYHSHASTLTNQQYSSPELEERDQALLNAENKSITHHIGEALNLELTELIVAEPLPYDLNSERRVSGVRSSPIDELQDINFIESLKLRAIIPQDMEFVIDAFDHVDLQLINRQYDMISSSERRIISGIYENSYIDREFPMLCYAQRVLFEMMQTSGKRYLLVPTFIYRDYRKDLGAELLILPPIAVIVGIAKFYQDLDNVVLNGSVYDIHKGKFLQHISLFYESSNTRNARIVAIHDLIYPLLEYNAE